MLDETSETSAIRSYLLGDLSKAEEIESWYFAAPQRVNEVWAVFSLMAEEYLSGDLSEGESRRFEQRLRSAPALREMFWYEKALYDYAARTATGTSLRAEPSDQVAGTGRKRQWPRAALFKPTRFVTAGVFALIALGAFVTWFGLNTHEGANPTLPKGLHHPKSKDQKSPDATAQAPVDPQPSPQSGRAASDKMAKEDAPSNAVPDQGAPAFKIRSGVTATFLLSAARSREEQRDPTLEISAQTGAIHLELELPSDDCAMFSAVLHTESNEELQRWDRLRALRDHSTPRVALRAQTNLLKNASYVIRLNCVSHSLPAEQYRFKLDKKAPTPSKSLR
jgi:hypothetical protein